MIHTILLIVLILAQLGAFPTRGYGQWRDWAAHRHHRDLVFPPVK
jgi:hypothetical protein